MTIRTFVTVAAAFGLMASQGAPGAFAARSQASSKQALTPAFFQGDPTAGFAGDGSNYCAPTAVSDGLIYLARARNMRKLVARTDHDGQVALIKQLASQMKTDPKIGTPPARILSGLKAFAKAQGVHVGRLEAAGWRPLGSANQSVQGDKVPQLAWLQSAARDPNTVLLLNVGWYRAEGQAFRRVGGHWITAIDAGPSASAFAVRNPATRVADQTRNVGVTFTRLNRGDFKVVKSPGNPADMAGYFKVRGPGLPSGRSTAVLDGAILFTLKP